MSKGRAAAVDRLRHMLEASDAIMRYTQRGRDAFDNDSAVQDAILYQIMVLGEAAKARLRQSRRWSRHCLIWNGRRSHECGIAWLTTTGQPTAKSSGQQRQDLSIGSSKHLWAHPDVKTDLNNGFAGHGRLKLNRNVELPLPRHLMRIAQSVDVKGRFAPRVGTDKDGDTRERDRC